VTWKPAYRAPFEPLPGPVDFVPYGDVPALAAALGPDTAAVILEPIQGEAGIVPAPDGYLTAARELTERHGALLVIDEVQTGIGRTGDWFAHTRHGIRPDVITVAKGLGAGIPIGACLARGRAAGLLGPGQHGSTFGGNPVAAAAALAVLRTLADADVLTHVRRVGEQLRAGLAGLHHPLIAQVRGEGLLLGIVLTRPVAGAVATAAADAGYLVGEAGDRVIRLSPPLILSAEQVEAALTDLPAILDRALAGASPSDGPAGTAPAGTGSTPPTGVPGGRP
jgi:acetylornithine aminotransferase